MAHKMERGISFFDRRPRKDKSRLFGRSEELNRLVNALHAKSWVAILGPRMAGLRRFLEDSRLHFTFFF